MESLLTTARPPTPTIDSLGQADSLKLMRILWVRASRSPFLFIRDFVFTLDVHDPETPIKPFPVWRPYMPGLIGLWLDNTSLVLCKSRQMMMTWFFCALCLWDVIFHPGRLVILQSQVYADAVGSRIKGTGLLGRCQFILDHIPCGRYLLGDAWFTDGDKTESLEFKHNSGLLPIAQGGNKIRSNTVWGWFSDESAFQPEFEDSYTAALACRRSLDDEPRTNGNKPWGVALSTADMHDGGYFKRLVHDEPDAR